MHQWQKLGENLSIDTGDIVKTWKSGMYLVMPWPWTLTFWPQNLISSSLSRDAPVTKVSRKSVNRYWRYRGNIKLPRESWTHGRTHARTDGRMHGRMTRKHIASAGAYRRRRLKNINNNNNNHDNVYGAVIMAEPLPEFIRFIWWMWNGAKRPPTQDHARRHRLWVRLYRLPESAPTIAIYYYYSARKLILILSSQTS